MAACPQSGNSGAGMSLVHGCHNHNIKLLLGQHIGIVFVAFSIQAVALIHFVAALNVDIAQGGHFHAGGHQHGFHVLIAKGTTADQTIG